MEIYTFNDGSKDRALDPVLTYRRLYAVCEQFDDLYQSSTQANPEGWRASEQVADVVAEVFGVKRFDSETGRGLTIDEVEKILDDFLEWLEKKSVSGNSERTSSPPMGAPC